MSKLTTLIAASLAFTLSASIASAACIGSDSFYTCNDTRSGNRYTVQKYGDTTTMRGSNPNTGATWSQNSTTYGNTTINRGRDSDGNSWRTTCFNGRCR